MRIEAGAHGADALADAAAAGHRAVLAGEHPRDRPGHLGDQGARRRPGPGGARGRRGAGRDRGRPGDAVEAGPGGAARVGAGRRAGRRWPRPAPRSDAVALANQGETVLAWDRAHRAAADPGDRLAGPAVGRGVRPAVRGTAGGWREITGLPLDPYFAAPKMTWLRENLTADGVVTTTDTWLLARLGAGYVTDAATASRTMLLDLDARGLVGARRAPCSASTRRRCPPWPTAPGVVGETTAFGAPLPVAGLAVDQQAALLRRALPRPPARPSAPTAPGAFLLADHRASARSGPRPGCPPRSPGGWPARPPTASTARSTRPARRSAG